MNSDPNNTINELTPAPVQDVIARNTLWNVAGRAWEAIAALVLTPYIVWRLGLSEYGVWGLVASFSGYVGLLDLGFGSGYAKFIAEYAARGEQRRISQLITSAVTLYAVLGVALAALCFPVLAYVATAFASRMGVPDVNAGDLVFLVQYSFTLFLLGNCVAPFTSIQAGLQRMDIANAVSFVMSIVKIAATVYFIENGFGLRGLMYSSAIVLGVYALASLFIAFWLLPHLRVSFAHVSRREFWSLYRYGWRAQVARLSNLITFETDIIVVSMMYRTMGLAGAYKVGVELANKVRQVPLMFLGAILPAASDLDAREDTTRLRRLYLVSTKYIAAITIPLALFSTATADTIMRAWMGADMGDAAWVFRLIVIGYAANVLQGPGVSVALGKGRPDVQMNAGIIAMISNLVLTITFAFAVGFLGVAAATAISMYISMVWFLRAMRNMTGVTSRAIWREAVLWPCVASLPGVVACVFIEVFAPAGSGRLESVSIMLGAAAVFGAVYLAILRYLPFLDSFDAHFLEHTLKLNRVPGSTMWLRRARQRTVRDHAA
ncbi:MAG: polysaccharide biosynthesis C-terminal domain-containing protein [Candidatus Hydrogenedentes bacterium]|nr:polysaccharide biosynthesis C-terminal domain-containing protein [Candidatus Hydrogenedentota bacterium]